MTAVRSTARRGAGVLLEILRSEGVEYVFGNPGTTELAFIDALLEAPDLHYVLALQEASAVAMADGYAQAARKPGFLNLHTAGGLGHGMGNLLNASVSHTPLVVTAGQQDSRHAITDPLLVGDLVRIAAPAVKWAREVTSVEQLPVLMHRAFKDARAAPTGPVFVSLPMDVMEAVTEVPIAPRSMIDKHFVAGSLGELARRLVAVAAGRLAIVAGDEIYGSEASAETVALAEALDAPVFGSSWPSRIAFPTAHPLWMGNLPTDASAIAERLRDYDAVFALGGKSLITIIYTEGPAIPDGCAVYQLSNNEYDLGRTYATDLAVVGDIKSSLRALLPLLPEPRQARGTGDSVYERAATRRREQRERSNAEASALFDAPAIMPIVAAREAVRAIGPDVAIVDEAIATSRHVRGFLNSWSTTQYSFLRGGALGWGMPSAVGASLGLGREPVVSLVGDGAALYSPQALWTAAHERLPVTFVVMNNREYNVLKNYLRAQTTWASTQSGRFLAMDIERPPVDFVALATAMGVPGRRIVRAADIAPAIESGIASGRPNLIEVAIAATS